MNRDEYWDYVVRAVLSQVDAAHLPAPITAEDVRAALDKRRWEWENESVMCSDIAVYLNRR